MSKQYRFGDFQRRSRGKHKKYSMNALTPKLERDAEGNLIPYQAPRVKLNASEVYNLIRPYVSVRMKVSRTSYMRPCSGSCCTVARHMPPGITFDLSTRFTHWMRQRLIYVYPCFRGQISVQRKVR